MRLLSINSFGRITAENWRRKILIGPSDWDDYSFGKDGGERYRIHNLPLSCSFPGVYELGIVTSHSALGHRLINPKKVIAVYLGQADNVRIRLQHYGRAGSHLDHGNSVAPGLFREIFSRGLPIAFRWAPTNDKGTAAKREAQLLETFDYAWNKGGNGPRRRDDILLKLDKRISLTSKILESIHSWKSQISGKNPVGMGISENILPGYTPTPHQDNENGKMVSSVSILSRSRPRLVQERCITSHNNNVSKVASNYGFTCRTMPVKVGKMLDKHKGTRFNGSEEGITAAGESSLTDSRVSGCILLEGGSPINKGVINGNYELPRDSVSATVPEICMPKQPNSHHVIGEWFSRETVNSSAAGISGSFCGTQQLDDGARCVQQRGMILNKPCSPSTRYNEYTVLCGVLCEDGSTCQEFPVEGRKRCELHKGRRVANSMSLPSVTDGRTVICGVICEDRSVCLEFPVHGRKRCELHKGRRIASTLSLPLISEVSRSQNLQNVSRPKKVNDITICGALLNDHSVCQNKPATGRKRCSQHKGMRISRSHS